MGEIVYISDILDAYEEARNNDRQLDSQSQRWAMV